MNLLEKITLEIKIKGGGDQNSLNLLVFFRNGQIVGLSPIRHLLFVDTNVAISD